MVGVRRTTLAARLKAVYGDVESVDAFVGMTSEKHVAGTEFARGLTNYSAADARRICGLRTEQIREILGALTYEEIVHRDNLVVII